MSFCQYSSSKKVKNYTEISNTFFSDYMSLAPDTFVKIYLYGLYLCQNDESNNSIEQFTKYFNLSEEDILGCFSYWQDEGLVKILDIEPFEVRYLEIIPRKDREKNIFCDKYASFCSDIQEIISGRMLNPTEFQHYITFLDCSKMQPSALLSVANYCVEMQGTSIGYNYVLTIAKDWESKGIVTQSDVVKHLDSLNVSNEILQGLLKILGITRKPNIDDTETFNLLTNDFGYSLELITSVAKNLKMKSKNAMTLLENKFRKYHELNLLTLEEIQKYEEQKEYYYNLAKTICKNLGTFYDNVEPVVENYIIKWSNFGYDAQTLEKISQQSFKTGIKTLEALDKRILSFYDKGLISLESINGYIADVVALDNEIKKILEKLQLSRSVCKADRFMYRKWIDDYNTSNELIDYAITCSIGATNPMQYLNRILQSYNIKHITTVEEAKKDTETFGQKNKNEPTKPNFKQREFTEEELNSAFTSLDEIDF